MSDRRLAREIEKRKKKAQERRMRDKYLKANAEEE